MLYGLQLPLQLPLQWAQRCMALLLVLLSRKPCLSRLQFSRSLVMVSRLLV